MKVTDFRLAKHPYKLFGRTDKPFNSIAGDSSAASKQPITLYDTNRRDSPFGGPAPTFNRASTATFIDSSGLLAVASTDVMRETYNPVATRTNLQAQSDAISGWFSNGGATNIANNVMAPDGTMTADTIIYSTGVYTEGVYRYTNLDAGTYIYSIYAKLITTEGTSRVRVGVESSGWGSGSQNMVNVYDLGTKTVISQGAGTVAAGIIDVGNGWCRLWFTGTKTTGGSTGWILYAATSNDNKRVAYWGAMTETGSTLRPYIPTGPFYEKLGYVSEEQRTNLALRGTDLSALWTTWQTTRVAASGISPDGTNNANKIVENTANTAHWLQQQITLDTAKTYTFSCYAKAAERYGIQIRISNLSDTNPSFANFDLTTGTHTGATGGSGYLSCGILPAGNGWYRVWMTATPDGTSQKIMMNLLQTSASPNYLGDGVSGLLVYGAQLEEGTFPTSYIPTDAAAVTRAADLLSFSNTSWMSVPSGMFYVEGTNSYSGMHMGMDYSAGVPRMHTQSHATGCNFYLSTAAGQITLGDSSSNVVGANFKMTCHYSSGNTFMARNGSIVGASTNPAMFPWIVPNRMRIGHRVLGSAQGWCNGGTVKKIIYYPYSFSQAAGAAMTVL